MKILLYYYIITFIYCAVMSIKKWNRDIQPGGLGISPGLDSIVLVLLCWVLAPIDIFLTFVRLSRNFIKK
jgi:hypothetical protein